MGKTIKKIWQKWYVQMLLIAIPFVMGLFGYVAYYNRITPKGDWTVWTPLYSTIKLFAFGFEAKPNDDKGITATGWIMSVLAIARILAVIPTGHAIFRMLRPLTKHLIASIKYNLIRKHRDQVMIFGSNNKNRMIYDSAKEKGGRIYPMILCETEGEFDELYNAGYNCINLVFKEEIAKIVKEIISSHNEKCRIVVNTLDDEKNLMLCSALCSCIRELLGPEIRETEMIRKAKDKSVKGSLLEKEEKIIQKLDRLQAAVFGSSQFETAYQKMEADSYGIIRCTNDATIAAMDLAARYPLTEFIDREKYIDENGCIAKNFEINVLYIGFGDTNQALFTSNMIINQYVEADEGEIPHPKHINYFIYDKKDNKDNKNLNHHIFRYSQEFLNGLKTEMYRKEDYLEIPPDPAFCTFVKTDINQNAFYEQVWTICSAVPGILNIINISLGDDLENIDLSQKLWRKIQEWALPNTHIFIKIRDADNEKLLQDFEGIYPFGDEKNTIFTMDKLFNDELENLTEKKHYMNNLVKSRKGKSFQGTPEEIEIHSRYEWHMFDAVKKMSSRYSVLSLRSKLHLMGLDYRKKQEGERALKSNDAYFNIYANKSRPEPDTAYEPVNGKVIYRYPKLLTKTDLTHQSLRQNLAIQEHYRWNAFMISCGFIPASREKIKTEKEHGKNYMLRTHGNLTTAAGLVDFRKLAARPGVSESSQDIIYHDFQIMDDAWWYLDMFGYEIFIR